ncbi:MAG: hypothetical protein ACOYNZ_20585 [Rhodoferax sp.]
MKLNPFRKKTNGYYDSVKAKFDKLDSDHQAKQVELAAVQAEYEDAKVIYWQMRSAAGNHSYRTSKEEGDQHLLMSSLYNRAGSLQGEIGQIESQLDPLRKIAQGPQQFEQAQAELKGLLEQRRSLTEEGHVTEALIAKLSKRVANLEARILSETNAASSLLITTEGEFNVPESLIKIEVELRLAKGSLADMQMKLAGIAVRTEELRVAIKDSERNFFHARSVVAEIELQEHLVPIMNLVARATVSRHQSNYSADQMKFEIDIPRALIEPTELELAEELPTA